MVHEDEKLPFDAQWLEVYLTSVQAAARALIAQVDQMLETNHLVRELLGDLRNAAHAVLDDVRER